MCPCVLQTPLMLAAYLVVVYRVSVYLVAEELCILRLRGYQMSLCLCIL